MKGDGISFPGFVTVSSTWESWWRTTHQAERHKAVKPTTAAGGSRLWSSTRDKHLQWFHGWWQPASFPPWLNQGCLFLQGPSSLCWHRGVFLLHSYCSANAQFGGYWLHVTSLCAFQSGVIPPPPLHPHTSEAIGREHQLLNFQLFR